MSPSKKPSAFASELLTFVRQLFTDSTFYGALFPSVDESPVGEIQFTPKWNTAKTVSIHWMDLYSFYVIFGDTPEGGEDLKIRKGNMRNRSILMEQLRHISPQDSAQGFAVRFHFLFAQVKIRLLKYTMQVLENGTCRFPSKNSLPDSFAEKYRPKNPRTTGVGDFAFFFLRPSGYLLSSVTTCTKVRLTRRPVKLVTFFTWKCTLPEIMAKSVSSHARATPLPGWNFVPR